MGESTIVAFKARPSASTGYFVVGVMQFLMGFLIGRTSPAGYLFVPAGLMMIYLSRWFATANILEFRDHSVRMATGPLASAQLVPYADIVRVERPDARVVELHLKGRVVKLPLAALAPEDAEKVVQEVERGRERSAAG